MKSSATTQLVSQIILSNSTTLSYGYDAEERITSVVETYTVDDTPVTNTTLYTYDALGQLLTETVNGEVVTTMVYDNYGNIVSKNGKQYCYDATWHDLLTCYDGQEIVYDAQGNPTSYLGHTLTWEKGRQLKKFDNIEYTYNANGIRTSKKVNGVLHTYTLDGTKILRETWNGNTLIPLYDNEDSVCGIIHNNVPYYFIKNLQGDVIAIVDKDATTVARYSYNAWGVPTITQDSVGIASINPFRYRSYYFDQEIGLYYLQSRYYDAQLGRWLNSDSIDCLGFGRKVSNNLFVYCENNAIDNSDPDGCAPFLGWGLQLEGSFMGISGGIEFIWYKNIARSVYGNRNLPCIYGYGGFSYNFKGGNVWNIKSLIKYVKNTASKTFASARKAAWKIGGGLSLCAFLVYGTINHPKGYTGPFITIGSTLFHIKTYYATSPKGDVYSWGLGVNSSKFGFSPLSFSGYEMLPANIITSVAGWFSSLFTKIKAVTNLI